MKFWLSHSQISYIITDCEFYFTLYRLSDESKKLALHHVYTDKIYRSGINPNDITFVDTLQELFIYIGPGANDNEKGSIWNQAEVSLRKGLVIWDCWTFY